MARYGLFVLKVPLNPNQPTPTLSVLVGWTLSKTQNLSTGTTFPVFRISSPRDEIHCSAMWWDSTTTRQPTAHYHRSQQQELAPALFLVGGDGQDARAIHGSSRSAMVQRSAFVPNGPRLVVVATLGWRNGPLLYTRSDDDELTPISARSRPLAYLHSVYTVRRFESAYFLPYNRWIELHTSNVMSAR